MLRMIALLVVFALSIAPSQQDNVDPSAACAKIGQRYSQGSSGLVAELLGRSYKRAGAYRLGGKIGLNNRYNAQPGTIVGFNGHLAVYIGNACGRCMFVDVQAPNFNARCHHGYGSQLVYKAYYGT